MEKLSTTIITLNEEKKIARCIQSVLQISDEVIVVDSHSTDRTIEIAEALGAIVYTHDFLGFSKQRALSISHATHNLVLALDADEHLSENLIEEIQKIKKQRSKDTYKLNRLSSISGKWIRHGSWHPDYIVRLFDKNKITCGGEPPHDKIIPNPKATIQKLKPVLYHDAHEDINDRYKSIINHSQVAAQAKYDKGIRSHPIKIWVKTIWKLISEYIVQLGFLDGYYGWIAAKSTAYYIYLRESKIYQLQKNKNE